jgi:hypothetical protein
MMIAGNLALIGLWPDTIPADIQCINEKAGVASAEPGPTGGAATEGQCDAVPLPGGSRLPLIGFGTYKVESVDAIT